MARPCNLFLRMIYNVGVHWTFPVIPRFLNCVISCHFKLYALIELVRRFVEPSLCSQHLWIETMCRNNTFGIFSGQSLISLY